MTQTDVENWCEANNFVLINIKRDDIPPEVVMAVAKQSCFLGENVLKRTRKQQYTFARYLTINYLDSRIPPVMLSKLFCKHHSMISYARNMMRDDIKFFKGWQQEAIKHFEKKMKEIEALHEKN